MQKRQWQWHACAVAVKMSATQAGSCAQSRYANMQALTKAGCKHLQSLQHAAYTALQTNESQPGSLKGATKSMCATSQSAGAGRTPSATEPMHGESAERVINLQLEQHIAGHVKEHCADTASQQRRPGLHDGTACRDGHEADQGACMLQGVVRARCTCKALATSGQRALSVAGRCHARTIANGHQVPGLVTKEGREQRDEGASSARQSGRHSGAAGCLCILIC